MPRGLAGRKSSHLRACSVPRRCPRGSPDTLPCQIDEYRIDAGHFWIFKVGEKRTAGFAINHVPNVFDLHALLDSIYQPVR